MAGSGGTLTWSTTSVTLAIGETKTVNYTTTFNQVQNDEFAPLIASVATFTMGTNKIDLTGTAAGTVTIAANTTVAYETRTANALTITVVAEDQNFLNERGLAHFWGNIDSAKQNKLTAGSHITINNDTISATQPTVNDATLTIQQNGSNVQTFTANQSTNATANITVPTKTSDLMNDGADGTSTYVEADELAPIATDGMAVLAYGASTWQDFIDAYNENRVVYCRASTDADPSVGDKTRLAPLIYADSESSPTSAQFHFHRSFAAHTDAQQGDQIIVYTLDSANGGTWSVATREAGTRVAAGTNMTSWYNNGVLTLSSAQPAAVNLTSSVTKASGVTINSGGSVFQIGKIVIINMDITTTASISAWGTILSGLPARTPASSVYFALVDDNNDRVLRAYLGGDGTIHTRGALSAGNYSIDLVYVTS